MMRKWFTILSVFAISVTALAVNVTPARAQEPTYINYIVVRGDTLGKIANEYCTRWQDIYNQNRDTIGDSPNVIRAGMVLTVPAYCNTAVQLPEAPPSFPADVVDSGPMNRAKGIYNAPYYTVAWGDNLYSIGLRFGVNWQEIAGVNNISGNTIYANRALLIPGAFGDAATPAGLGTTERVNFQTGTSSATRTGIIYQGAAKSYILWGRAGQTITVNAVSHGEALVVSIGNTRGDLLPLLGENSKINNTVSARLPESGDFIVTVRPLVGPENPQLAFDITFVIH